MISPATLLALYSAGEPVDPDRLELGVLPVVNYDSDLGFGFGAFGAAAQFDPAIKPWRWRLEGVVFATLAKKPGGGVEVPFTKEFVQLDLPGLLEGHLRLFLLGAFTRHWSRGYFGTGNAATIDEAALEANPRLYQYDRIYPSGEVVVRLDPDPDEPGLGAFAGLRYTQTWINVYEGSLLERDRSILEGVRRHGEIAPMAGVYYDTRDREMSPSGGQFHELSLRGGAGIGESFDYAGVNLVLRAYFSIYERYLVVAVRLIGDVLSNDAPFYELARSGGLLPQDLTGGSRSIRGVAAQRYHARIKGLANLEVRFEVPPFELFGQRIFLGGAVAGDAGRVWSAFRTDPELDGTGPGIAFGFGGGVRIRWGDTFVIRGDVAYAPGDRSTGVYIDLNHAF